MSPVVILAQHDVMIARPAPLQLLGKDRAIAGERLDQFDQQPAREAERDPDRQGGRHAAVTMPVIEAHVADEERSGAHRAGPMRDGSIHVGDDMAQFDDRPGRLQHLNGR
ncbi:MAG: hypothetical protein WDN69_17045 [Aliidongia sp.]